MANEIKHLPPDCKSFEAGGIKFLVYDTLTVDGFMRLEELRVESEIGVGAAELVKMVGKAYAELDKGHFAQSAVLMYNAINAGEQIRDKRPPVWLLSLSLFVRPENFGAAAWSETDATEWIRLWSDERIAVEDFFRLATERTEIFATGFNPPSLNISDNGSEEEGAEARGSRTVAK